MHKDSFAREVIEGAIPAHGWLQLFADSTDTPDPAGNPDGVTDEQPVVKTFTEAELQARIQAEVKKATDSAGKRVRLAVEAEYKPKLAEAEQALTAAKPFLDDPSGYMAQYLAQNPTQLQAVADGVDRLMKGQMPTQQQINTVAKAADGATDPKVAKQLEALQAELKTTRESMQAELKATREATEEQKTLDADLKAFGKEAKEAGLEWDPDTFLTFVNDYADKNEIGDEDAIDTRLMFRLWKAEQKLANPTPRKVPRLPGAAAPVTPARERPKTWAEAEDRAAALLRGAQDD